MISHLVISTDAINRVCTVVISLVVIGKQQLTLIGDARNARSRSVSRHLLHLGKPQDPQGVTLASSRFAALTAVPLWGNHQDRTPQWLPLGEDSLTLR
ncbi:hypothetical protein A6770_13670 [Nostoc minutum NIES-26]|uniref:Uncharacterized protein n=1 Tax=Nostoc minutum NIES-26 TaxID=1844469 RepID=A0A367RQS4_9NOSO|nr:hypothetical protein A6770_13670 [Nostoc minutum NIES-26]